MPKKSHKGPQTPDRRHKFNKKKFSAVTFDENERESYLKGMYGAKKRRKQHYIHKVEEEGKIQRKMEKAEIKHRRKEQIEKLKKLLQIQDDVGE